ncbi:MAG: TldD/PmbA family protein [Candidatus Eiseniibacteriota bacterium]
MATAPPVMLATREEAQKLLEGAIEIARARGADQAEAILEETDSALTRFANNQIHQNVASHRRRLTFRVFRGAKIGVAGTNRADREGVEACITQALEIARHQPDDPDAGALPDPAPVKALESVAAATADATPDTRADAVRSVTEAVRAAGYVAAGALSNDQSVRAVANSRGVFAHHPSTIANFTCTVMAPDSSGWVDAWHRDLSAIDPAALGRIAIEKARVSARPRALPAGRYTVILEPNAVAELVSFLAWLGFGAQQVQEGQSFLTGRLGEAITGPRISIADDAFDPRGAGSPFDFEGVPRQRVPLIENGTAKAVVYDTRTARKDGVVSTGHASATPPNPEGPAPYDLVLAAGDSSVEEMIKSTERGLLVTRFWYNRVVDPRKTLITGMTRDGTFWIEKGEIQGGVRNLRFNESVLDVLARAEAISRTAELTVFDYSNAAVTAPALKVRDFQFTGVTEF